MRFPGGPIRSLTALSRGAGIGVTALLPGDTSASWIVPILKEPFVLGAGRGALNPAVPVEMLLALPYLQYSESLLIGQRIPQQMERLRLNPPRCWRWKQKGRSGQW